MLVDNEKEMQNKTRMTPIHHIKNIWGEGEGESTTYNHTSSDDLIKTSLSTLVFMLFIILNLLLFHYLTAES